MRRLFPLFVLVVISLQLGCAHLVFVALDPGDDFDPSATPVPPDYGAPTSWATFPGIDNLSRTALPSHPAVDVEHADADVFFVHTTTHLSRDWNAPVDDDEVRKNTDTGSALIQESVFNHCCRIYTPHYRQANGDAFLSPRAAGEQALQVAFDDVNAAFATYRQTHQRGRPYFIASHSQGAYMAARLLREVVALDDDAKRSLIAAYVVGGPVRPSDVGSLPPCKSKSDVGCVLAFNARSVDYDTSALEFAGAPVDERLCVNPLDPSAPDGVVVDKSEHGGAVFFDAETPEVLPQFTSAACQAGRLVVDVPHWPDRGFAPELLMDLYGKGNFHAIEYQMFYLPLRDDITRRLRAFVDGARAMGP